MALKLYQEDVIEIFTKSIKIRKVYLGNNLIKGERISFTIKFNDINSLNLTNGVFNESKARLEC